MPLAVPYEDSPPEARVLNAVAAGLVFEGRSTIAPTLGMQKAEFGRVLSVQKNEGMIHVGGGGRYVGSFPTSNFPNIISK